MKLSQNHPSMRGLVCSTVWIIQGNKEVQSYPTEHWKQNIYEWKSCLILLITDWAAWCLYSLTCLCKQPRRENFWFLQSHPISHKVTPLVTKSPPAYGGICIHDTPILTYARTSVSTNKYGIHVLRTHCIF